MFKKAEPTAVDKMIAKLTEELDNVTSSDPQYEKIMNRLFKLYELKAAEMRTQRVSADTKALIIANLVGIMMIISYEHAHVITSKALSLFISKKF